MGLTELSNDVRFTWQLLFDKHEDVKRRKLTNRTTLEVLSNLCVTDKARLQIEAELQAHLEPLSWPPGKDAPPPEPPAPKATPKTPMLAVDKGALDIHKRNVEKYKRDLTKGKRLNGFVVNTSVMTAKLISLALDTITKLYQSLVERPKLGPSVKHLQEILIYVTYAIGIWVETVDREGFRCYTEPVLKRSNRQLARAAHMQYCGQILLMVCRLTWPEDQHEWIEEKEIIFNKEAQDFADAFFFDGALTYRFIYETRKTVLDGDNGPRKQYVVLHRLDKLRHDGKLQKGDWHVPDPALPHLVEFVKSARKRRRDNGEKGFHVDESDGDGADILHPKPKQRKRSRTCK